MVKKYTLMGEDFFRTMTRLEDERRRRSDMLCAPSNASDRGASNIVSLDRYRRERHVQRPTNKRTDPVA